jgi:hypothetical protein
MEWLKTDWFHTTTEAYIRALHRQGGQLQPIYDHINTFFDAHVINRANDVCVTINCPNPWPPVLGSVWHAAGEDEDRAAMFLGNLYCRVAIARPDKWWSAPIPYLKATPRHYVLASDMIGSNQ